MAASASQRMEGLNLSFSGAWLTKLILVKMENHSTLQIAKMTQMETGNTVLKILIIFTLVSFILSAHTNYTIAQVEGNEQQDEWNPISIGPATTWTASLCGKGEFVIQPFFFYSMARGMFDTEGNYDSLPGGDKEEDGAKIPASDSNSLTSTTGVSWSNGKLQTLLGYQRAQIGTNADANDAVVFTLIYPF